MISVKVKDGESFDNAMRRFKRSVEKGGIPKELRRREFHLTDSALRQRNAAAARKRLLKRLARDKMGFEEGGSRAGARGRRR